jgi:hypothetical protein
MWHGPELIEYAPGIPVGCGGTTALAQICHPRVVTEPSVIQYMTSPEFIRRPSRPPGLLPE